MENPRYSLRKILKDDCPKMFPLVRHALSPAPHLHESEFEYLLSNVSRVLKISTLKASEAKYQCTTGFSTSSTYVIRNYVGFAVFTMRKSSSRFLRSCCTLKMTILPNELFSLRLRPLERFNSNTYETWMR